MVDGVEFKNVICVIGKDRPKTIVVGAHYDVCEDQEGADDNASGVVGLLELVKLTARADIDYRLEIVAFTLEEPPYFRTENMGSAIHAKSHAPRKESIEGMICLEMIGYFKQEKNTQEYPLKILKMVQGKQRKLHHIGQQNWWWKNLLRNSQKHTVKTQNCQLKNSKEVQSYRALIIPII